MISHAHSDVGFPASVFDALPFPAFIMDEDVRFLAVNSAAARFLKSGSETAIHQRWGEILHCISSTDGCGQSKPCSDCVIRGSVGFALTGGESVRRRARLEYLSDGQVQEMHALITASPIVYENAPRVLLFIEDLTLLFAMTDVLPICMGCKKVLNDDLWLQIEAYLDSHLDLKFTHGICPDCSQRLYPDEDGLSR